MQPLIPPIIVGFMTKDCNHPALVSRFITTIFDIYRTCGNFKVAPQVRLALIPDDMMKQPES
jgi:hypothetical protein